MVPEIESAATMENPMGLPQWLGKPLTRFTTLPTPLRSPPFSPPTFSLSERKNIGWEYPYRGLRLSIQQFPIFSCYYSLSERDFQALRTGFFYSSMPPIPRWCCCCSCYCPISGSGSSSLAFSSRGRRRSGKCSSKKSSIRPMPSVRRSVKLRSSCSSDCR